MPRLHRMSAGSGGGPPHDAGVRRTGHPEGSVGEGRYADGVFPARFPAETGRKKAPVAASGIVRAWPFLKPRPGYAAAFREMAAPSTGGE